MNPHTQKLKVQRSIGSKDEVITNALPSHLTRSVTITYVESSHHVKGF